MAIPRDVDADDESADQRESSGSYSLPSTTSDSAGVRLGDVDLSELFQAFNGPSQTTPLPPQPAPPYEAPVSPAPATLSVAELLDSNLFTFDPSLELPPPAPPTLSEAELLDPNLFTFDTSLELPPPAPQTQPVAEAPASSDRPSQFAFTPSRRLPPNPKLPEGRTSLENSERRAYVAASRRSDRSIEARMESARKASLAHKARTGRSLRVTEADVRGDGYYEEVVDDDPPMQISLATPAPVQPTRSTGMTSTRPQHANRLERNAVAAGRAAAATSIQQFSQGYGTPALVPDPPMYLPTSNVRGEPQSRFAATAPAESNSMMPLEFANRRLSVSERIIVAQNPFVWLSDLPNGGEAMFGDTVDPSSSSLGRRTCPECLKERSMASFDVRVGTSCMLCRAEAAKIAARVAKGLLAEMARQQAGAMRKRCPKSKESQDNAEDAGEGVGSMFAQESGAAAMSDHMVPAGPETRKRSREDAGGTDQDLSADELAEKNGRKRAKKE